MPAAANALLGFNWPQDTDKSAEQELWISAQGRDKDSYSISWAGNDRDKTEQVLSGFRGHGLSQNPTRPEQVIMFARRPGTIGLSINVLGDEAPQPFHSPPGHHMHGHGCFSADGQFFYSAESDYRTGEGKIIVRRSDNLQQVSEFSSHGIGPHEIALMPDGKTLAIANGGLLTHPDQGRKVLNLDSMRSTLSYVDIQNGELITELTVEEEKASIRHLDVASNGHVALAIQVQRKGMQHGELVPLAALHKPGKDQLESLHAPEALTLKLNDYMGSVRLHAEKNLAAFTSPKGDLAMFWDTRDLSLQGYHAFHDVCGLTLTQDNKHFVLSNSAGKLRFIDSTSLKENKSKRLYFPETSWDNHMLTLSLPS